MNLNNGKDERRDGWNGSGLVVVLLFFCSQGYQTVKHFFSLQISENLFFLIPIVLTDSLPCGLLFVSSLILVRFSLSLSLDHLLVMRIKLQDDFGTSKKTADGDGASHTMNPIFFFYEPKKKISST